MKHLITFSFYLLLISNVQAQVSGNSTFISDPMSNTPYYGNNSDISGNVFMNTKWSAGSIKTAKGIHYTNMTLKFDVLNNDVIFLINDSNFIFAEEIKEFILNTGSKNGNPARFVTSASVNIALPAKYVQVLAEGKMGFYLHLKKNIVTATGYGVADKKVLEDKNTYYTIQNGSVKSVNLNKKSLEEIVGDKWPRVNQYLEQNNLSAKSEQGWAAAITYYNTL
jgi:hypothetical protein